MYSKKAPKGFQRYPNYHIYSAQDYLQQRHPNSGSSSGLFDCTLLASYHTAKPFNKAASHLLELPSLHDASVKCIQLCSFYKQKTTAKWLAVSPFSCWIWDLEAGAVAAKLFPRILSTSFSLQTPIIPVCPLKWLCILCNSAVIQEGKDYAYFIHLYRNSHDVTVSKYFYSYFCSSKWVVIIIIQKKVVVRKSKVISMCSFIHMCLWRFI